MRNSLRPIYLGLLGLVLSLVACKSYLSTAAYQFDRREQVIQIPASSQYRGGNPEKGFEYLVTGDHVGNGIPFETHLKFFGEEPDSILNREGDNGRVSYAYNVFQTDSGHKVVSGNCFVCHASRLNGKLIFGLGNSAADFTQNQTTQIKALNLLIRNKYGKDSPEWAIYKEQAEWFKAVTPAVVMNNRGTNPAFRLEEAAIAYRDPRDLTYRDKPWYEIADPAIGSDVPPLWNVKKKHALYYNGGGQGDFTKLLMQVSVLGIHDSTVAREVQQRFIDVLAWLESLEPPAYPEQVDQTLAVQGKMLFQEHCKKCHGTYSNNPEAETYPNKVIPIHMVKTDPAYAGYAIQSTLDKWYNGSWYGQSPIEARLETYYGYIAPPLDGIWATAPYLHNGSVPTLADLLNSSQRPTYWRRSFDSHDYDYDKMGWSYTVEENGRDADTFDTTRPGAGNQGHEYGDILLAEERKALLEYLKTL